MLEDKLLTLFILAGALALICLFIEISICDFLETSSSDYIYWLQRDYSEVAKTFFIIIAQSSEYISMGIGFFIYLFSYNKTGALCIILTFAIVWLGGLLKMAIAHPRPFWYDSRVEAMACPNDFGSPSGHALLVGSVVLYFYFSFFQQYKLLSSITAAVLLGLVGFDRNYLGVHFYFQVVLGYCLSFFVVVGASFSCIRDFLLSTKKDMKKLMIVVTGGLLGLVAGTLLFCFRNPEFREDWKINYLNKCTGNLSLDIALAKSYKETSAIMIALGFVVGLHFNNYTHRKSWSYIVAAYMIFMVGGGIQLGLEIMIKRLDPFASFILLSILRFCTGIYTSLFIPFLLSKCFKSKNPDLVLPLT